MELRKVVTAFLEHEGRILILKRSDKVGSYKGKWAGVSGYVERDEDPMSRALLEIWEELRLTSQEVHLAEKGKLMLIPDEELGVLWIVYPYLFKTEKPTIKIDWEHDESRWITPSEIDRYETVPMLKQTLKRVIKINSQPIPSSQVTGKLDEIAADRRLGARQLVVEAIRILKLAAETCEANSVEECLTYLEETANRLVVIKPSMASFSNAIDTLYHRAAKFKTSNLASLKAFVKHEAEQIIRGLEESSIKAVEEASKQINDGYTVLTYSRSSTVLEVFRQTTLKGKKISAIVSESRPLYEGRQLAEELSTLGIPVTFITDSAVGHFMSGVDMVLVGADSILADGSVVNKIGTYLVALAAKDKSVPFYSVCELSKFNVRNYLGEETVLEEKEPSEVLDVPLAGVTVRNVYFDVTPAKLVSAIITEEGIITPENVPQHMEKILQQYSK